MIKLIVVTKTRLYGEGLAKSLDQSKGIRVAGCALNQRQALRLLARERPDVVLIDIDLPDSLAITSAMKRTPNVSIMALGVEETESEIIRWAKGGVAGYVPRGASLADLARTIRAVVSGETLCTPRIARTLLDTVQRADTFPWKAAIDHLTPRELEILRLSEKGLHRKEIAQELCVEESTVKNHLHSAYEKLDVHSRADALARLHGDLEPLAP